jgi:hypothetical protein
MRFMVITKATAASEAGRPPATEDFAVMGKFIDEMIDAGVLLQADGLHPSTAGARIYVERGKKDGDQKETDKKTVVDGPFTETKELIAGFFLVETKSLEECVEWFKRMPLPFLGEGETTNIEIRRVALAEDFGDEFAAEREAVERREAQVADRA